MSDAGDFHDEVVAVRSYDTRLMRRLLSYVRPYRGMAVLAVALIVLSSLLQLVGPILTAVTLDVFVQPLSDSRKAVVSQWVEALLAKAGIAPDPASGITVLAFGYLVVLVSTFCVLYAQSYVMQMMGQKIMYDLRKQIFGRLQHLHVAYFDSRPIGRLVTRATTDVAALNELFTAGLVSIFGDVVLLVGIVGLLFALNFRLALASFAILPLLMLLTFWFKDRAGRSYREVRVRVARINAFLQEHITGMPVVQLFGREERAFSDFSEANDAHRRANVEAILYYAVYYPGVELVTALGLGLIVGYGGSQVLSGVLSLGALVAFLQYAQRFYQPIADLSEKYNILQAAMASSERIFELLDTQPEIVSPVAPYRPERARGEIGFDTVSFSYLPDEPVLRDLTLQIAAGETIAIVGHTGAGKSTLASLLLRFYDTTTGHVTVDGVDVRQWDLATLRGSIAMVLQDVFLFAGDVAGNIRLGESSISDERLRWAAAEVGALDFIEQLPEGFASPVRERGAGFSVGQKQLIAFARALAFDPRILILDEATASIDTESEQKIQRALDRLLNGRTSLVIAHRLSTIQKADRIVVLHKGELREIGTHHELLAQRGIYYRLYQLQYRDETVLAAD
ncbi:MAG: ABC transporter ATP-binding protein [Thermoanaerobaculia bacterium]|nr:ABC transporter ATP-binding protein [Thermoanaerobaculia bacterium]